MKMNILSLAWGCFPKNNKIANYSGCCFPKIELRGTGAYDQEPRRRKVAHRDLVRLERSKAECQNFAAQTN